MPSAEGEKENVAGLGASLGLRRPVIVYDGFEAAALRWTGAGSGSETVDRVTDQGFAGEACLHLKCQTTSPAENEYVEATRQVYFLPSKRVAMDFRWYVDTTTDVKRLEFGFTLYDGTYKNYCFFALYLKDGEVRQQKGSTQWTKIAGGDQEFRPDGWHFVSMLIDVELRECVRLVVDDVEYDLEGESVYTSNSGYPTHLIAEFKLTNETTNAAEGWFDEVMLREW